jgi:hypothetical protein
MCQVIVIFDSNSCFPLSSSQVIFMYGLMLERQILKFGAEFVLVLYFIIISLHCPVYKTENTAVGIRRADYETPCILKIWY